MTMRAYKLYNKGPKIEESLNLESAPIPKPGQGQVLVRVRAVSLNFRDILLLRRLYPVQVPETGLIPVSDGAGEVEEVGEGVTKWKKGDRVWGNFIQDWLAGDFRSEYHGSVLGGPLDGLLADYRVLPENGLLRVPNNLSFEEASTLPIAALTAWHAVFGVRPATPDQSVLALGTGGVSIFALQFAKLAGARVVITSSSDEKLARAKALGADDLINYKSSPDWEKDVLKVTNGRGVDHVVEVGGAGTLQKSIASVKPGGIVHIIGILSQLEGGGQYPSSEIVRDVLFRGLTVRGLFVGSKQMAEDMNRAIEQHDLHPVIDKVFPFEQAKEAYKYLESGSHFGKVVIKIA